MRVPSRREWDGELLQLSWMECSHERPAATWIALTHESGLQLCPSVWRVEFETCMVVVDIAGEEVSFYTFPDQGLLNFPFLLVAPKRLDILVIVSWHLGDWLISYLCRFSHPLRKENVVYISDVALKFPAMIYFQLVSRSKVRPVQLKRPPFFMQMLHLFSSFCLHIICTSVFLPVYSSHPVSIIAWNKGFCWSFCVMIFFPWSCWRWRSGVFYCAWVCKRGLSDPRRARVGLTNLFSVPFSSVLDGEFVEFQLFCQWEWR